MRLALTAAALLLAALPAQRGSAQDADAVESCLREAWPRDPRALCVGIVSAPCQTAAGGAATDAMQRCLAREAAAWDRVMIRQLPDLMRRAREIDAAAPQPAPGIDTAAATQEAAQRAWLTYRDAECRSAFASWGAGGFREIAHSACLLDLTARRVVDLQARLMTGG